MVGVSVTVGTRVVVLVAVGVWVSVGITVGVGVAEGVAVKPNASTKVTANSGATRAVRVIAKIVPVRCKSEGKGLESNDKAHGSMATNTQATSSRVYRTTAEFSLEITLKPLYSLHPVGAKKMLARR